MTYNGQINVVLHKDTPICKCICVKFGPPDAPLFFYLLLIFCQIQLTSRVDSTGHQLGQLQSHAMGPKKYS